MLKDTETSLKLGLRLSLNTLSTPRVCTEGAWPGKFVDTDCVSTKNTVGSQRSYVDSCRNIKSGVAVSDTSSWHLPNSSFCLRG